VIVLFTLTSTLSTSDRECQGYTVESNFFSHYKLYLLYQIYLLVDFDCSGSKLIFDCGLGHNPCTFQMHLRQHQENRMPAQGT